MDCELVGSQSDDSVSSDGKLTPPSLSEQFETQFAAYLAMGMTPEQYWDGDPMLAKYYREAEEIRNEKRNQELWLQGMYVYEAILCASPVLQAFAKKGAKAKPYSDRPYAITKLERRRERIEKEKAVFAKGKRYMEALVASINKGFQPS